MTSQEPEKPAIEDTWPRPDYDPGPQKHVHAIGVIALTYATLQSAMDRLFLDRANSEWAEKYYYMLSEETRSDAIKEVFKDDQGVVGAVGNLVKYFDWCRACRNNLLHAESYPSGLVPFPDGALGLTKRLTKGSTESGYIALTLEGLRGVADRMRDGIVQCMKIHLFLRHRGRPEGVPEKYREYARSLPPHLSVPKPIVLASSPRHLWAKGKATG
ncbi:MAG TPA: hypothetical protein VFE60_06830 [Roseiarcus sp.]|jgi:hypothetical protein|nr:hypothetical protein [Roseiarcus sp.]